MYFLEILTFSLVGCLEEKIRFEKETFIKS